MHLWVFAELGVMLLATYVIVRGFALPRDPLALVLAGLFVALFIGVFLERWETGQPTPALAIVKLIDSGYFSIVAAVLVVSAGSFWKGMSDAETRERFLVSQRDSSIVVLRQYGDRIVAGRIVKGENVVDSEVRIYLRAGDAGASEFVERKLGRLKFEP
jgi:hypothetical protein